jgi:hypothetical protein
MDAAQQEVPGINRVDLQQEDLSVPGREMVQYRVELRATATSMQLTSPPTLSKPGSH